MKQYRSGRVYLAEIVAVILMTALDQWTKHLAVVYLMNRPPHVLIRGVLELRYLENSGAAFSMLQNQQVFFWILTLIFVALAAAFLIRVPKTGRYLPLMVTVTVLIAGALGNFIDRITQHYVVDFIYFSIIDFPIFNVADIYVTISVIVLAVLILFHYKEDDFRFLSRKKRGE